MILGIDASNIRQGGGITHLKEFLNASIPSQYGFSRVVIWAGLDTLNCIESQDWLLKLNHPLLNKSLPARVIWQRFFLKKAMKTTKCNLLFVPGGSDISHFEPMVSMNQNLLPFTWPEIRRYGFSITTFKFLLLRFTQTRTFRKANGMIFLTHHAKQIVQEVTGALTCK